jgi:guanylate kinase
MTELLQTHSQLVLVPSYTTRPMRPNEKNGRKYWHISMDEFQNSINNWEFFEHAIYSNNYYGTKLSHIKQAFDKWLAPITEIEMNGFRKIKENDFGIQYVSIFLTLPDDVMIDRIKLRWSVTQEEIDRRVASAYIERVKAKELCDYVVDASGTVKENLKNINKILKNIVNG